MCSCFCPILTAATVPYVQKCCFIFSKTAVFYIIYSCFCPIHCCCFPTCAQLDFPRLTAAAFLQMYQAAFACTPFFMYSIYTYNTSSVFHLQLLLPTIYCCCFPTCKAALPPYIQLLFSHMHSCFSPRHTAAVSQHVKLLCPLYSAAVFPYVKLLFPYLYSCCFPHVKLLLLHISSCCFAICPAGC